MRLSVAFIKLIELINFCILQKSRHTYLRNFQINILINFIQLQNKLFQKRKIKIKTGEYKSNNIRQYDCGNIKK